MYLLDITSSGLLVLTGVIVFLLVLGLVEGGVLYKYKVTSFRRAIGQAVMVNLISVVFGFILFYFLEREQYSGFAFLDTGSYSLPLWMVLWALSVGIEGLLLKTMNRSKSWGLILKASTIMNLLTFIILFAYSYFA